MLVNMHTDTFEIALAEEVRLVFGAEQIEPGPVTFRAFKLFRGSVEIGSGDYTACHECRIVRLGEIGFVGWEQRRGFGTQTLAQCRNLLPGYRWCLTSTKQGSDSYWQRWQSAYPDEYYSGRDPRGRSCDHLRA